MATDFTGKAPLAANADKTSDSAAKTRDPAAASDAAAKTPDGERTAEIPFLEEALKGARVPEGNPENAEDYRPVFYTAVAAMPKNLLSHTAFSVYRKLEEEGISYRAIFHPALFTREGVKTFVPVNDRIVVVKNLFLRNDTGSKTYLLVQCYDKHADLKALRAFLGSSRLGFCSEERLEKYLCVKAGSVSPLCIANDADCRVQLILDEDLQRYPVICMHPNDNTGSLYLTYGDLLRFAKKSGHAPLFYRV